MPRNYDEIVLIGDCGAVKTDGTDLVLNSLAKLLPSKPNSAVIFLGDNIYPEGLPPEEDENRAKAESRLKAQLQAVEKFPGKKVFISGNHDWQKGKADGLEYVLRQEAYVNAFFGDKEVFLPAGGQPGPVEINFSAALCIVVINTHWWIHKDKPVYENA
ncbi:MAG: metallophosphoesterase, partial [Bacteroidota bacterium]